MEKYTKDQIKEFIENDMPCVYCRGWRWKGGMVQYISKEEALNLFPKYNVGKGFYELSVIDIDGVQTIEFNELSANDMW